MGGITGVAEGGMLRKLDQAAINGEEELEIILGLDTTQADLGGTGFHVDLVIDKSLTAGPEFGVNSLQPTSLARIGDVNDLGDPIIKFNGQSFLAALLEEVNVLLGELNLKVVECGLGRGGPTGSKSLHFGKFRPRRGIIGRSKTIRLYRIRAGGIGVIVARNASNGIVAGGLGASAMRWQSPGRLIPHGFHVGIQGRSH